MDMDTKALKEYYPAESWNNVCEVIKKHMLNNGFIWIQGSLYVSEAVVTHVRKWGRLPLLVHKLFAGL